MPVNNYFIGSELVKEGIYTNTESSNNKKTQLHSEIEIILPSNNKEKITTSLINSFELSINEKKINNLALNINHYSDLSDLDSLLKLKAKPGKIFIGTLSLKATELVKHYCDKEILFFSFAPNKDFAGECVYLINFFPEDDLRALFNFFPPNSKIALLYPENFYGYYISKIIDSIAAKSKSLIINRSSYKEDLTDARISIKKLSNYESRKKEIDRQKKNFKKQK